MATRYATTPSLRKHWENCTFRNWVLPPYPREVRTKESGAAITRIGLRSSAQSQELNQYSLLEEGIQQEITGRIQSISHSQSYAGISQACTSQLASPLTTARSSGGCRSHHQQATACSSMQATGSKINKQTPVAAVSSK